jgi:hypothetical protein
MLLSFVPKWKPARCRLEVDSDPGDGGSDLIWDAGLKSSFPEDEIAFTKRRPG